VAGSVVLLAGHPGVGKSTLVLQLLDGLIREGRRTLLVSGEESPAQIGLRGRRLGIELHSCRAVSTTSLDEVVWAARRESPDVVVLDSIQTVQSADHEQSAGSVVQVRECAAALTRHAKLTDTTIVLVGHVTKDGQVAGPKTLEHVVDVVLSLENERSGALRLLRPLKNRFGSCDELGVFAMSAGGLEAVEDPSAMLLADRRLEVPGSIVYPSMEGLRPMLVEVQALTTRSNIKPSRRVASGVDGKRLSLIIGVLAERAGLELNECDVFVAAAGGLAVREPAADLALCVALASSKRKVVVDPTTIAVGEIGLSGDVRRVPGIKRRLSEAQRLGFKRAIVPEGVSDPHSGLDLVRVGEVKTALDKAVFERRLRSV
jgi:DNA repair protein RadA/Sms